MKKFLVSITLALASLAATPAQSSLTGSPGQSNEKVDKLFAQWDKPDSPGCALGVIKDGQFVYKRGYGSANLDYNAPLTSESVFYIASTSKQFTAASILLLVRRGAISLDDDIRKYFPELPRYEAPITVNHLVHHTSGVRDYLELMGMAGRKMDEPFDNEEAVELIVRQKGLNFKPGERFLYSNSNYVLMAEIVRRASGKSLREFADENIFRPLGMTNTHFNDDRTAVVKNRVVSYAPISPGRFRQFVKTIEAMGDGNLLTTVDDLAKWDQNFYDNKVGGEGFSQQMLTRTKLNNGEEIPYAFGLGNEEYKGLKAVAHGGGFMGFRTEMIRFPEQRFTAICLCNVGTANPGALARQVADIYLADQLKPAGAKSNSAPAAPAPRQPLTLTAGQLAEYIGAYYSDELDATYRIVIEEGNLFIKARNAPRASLVPQTKDEFRRLGSTFSFMRNDQRQITGFTLNGGRSTGIKFVRKAN
ncbi:MAG TPA: serine hydrolase domain-containing protein [Blastocatellia bacterium]|nr:serine hydrolase domain-containing protein [Blastocatellia bacterium]